MRAVPVLLAIAGLGTLVWFAVLGPEPTPQRAGAMAPTVDEDTALKFGEDHKLFWTVPFVTFGIGRYMVLVQGGRGGDSPTRIFLGGDRWFLANLVAWAGVVLFALFGPR